MNKKILAAAMTAAMLFGGCSNGNSDKAAGETEKTATVENVTATVTKDESGKIVKVVIDEFDDEGVSKKDLGEEYGMKDASSIGKEWNEQIEFLENYIVENGIDAVKVNADGYAEEDVKTGCTVYIASYLDAVKQAAE